MQELLQSRMAWTDPIFGARVRAVLVLVLLFASGTASHAGIRALSTNTVHLGKAGAPEWAVFEGKTPAGKELRLTFQATENRGEATLFIRQDDVKQEWAVTLNDRKIGSLFLMEADLVHTIAVPPGALRDGENELRIFTRHPEDILVHEILLGSAPKRELLSAGLDISVQNAGTGELVPCRITIVNGRRSMAALHGYNSEELAVRPGVVYTANGRARVGLLPGRYTVHATRGPEHDLAEELLTVREPGTKVNLRIRRDVDTSGWIAADTHIHTLALSGHGDASLAERAITIAGEGVELAVATEHNLHASYNSAARELGLAQYFTAVAGNEVTTRRGHFNIFPVALEAPMPDWKAEHWPELVSSMRKTPGVELVVLNHPADSHAGFTPFAATHLNLASGRNLRGDFEFNFDAMEVINSGAMRSDWMEPFRAWMALLNRGRRITAVGSSDSHDASRFIVGQGRTYIRGDDSKPGSIDVEAACAALKDGRAVVSLGLFLTLKVSDAPENLGRESAGPGELHSASGREIALVAKLGAADWLKSKGNPVSARVRIYANGTPAYAHNFRGGPIPETWHMTNQVSRPAQDTHYIAIAEAPGFAEPYWTLARPYQPSSKEWRPVLLAATNPAWVDADGDGQFTFPREYAERLVKKYKNDPASLIRALAGYDPATIIQTADLLYVQGIDLSSTEVREALESAPRQVREGFEQFIRAEPGL